MYYLMKNRLLINNYWVNSIYPTPWHDNFIESDEANLSPSAQVHYFLFPRKSVSCLQLSWPSYWLSMLSFICDCPRILTLIWTQMKISWAAINKWREVIPIRASLGRSTLTISKTETFWIFSSWYCQFAEISWYLMV